MHRTPGKIGSGLSGRGPGACGENRQQAGKRRIGFGNPGMPDPLPRQCGCDAVSGAICSGPLPSLLIANTHWWVLNLMPASPCMTTAPSIVSRSSQPNRSEVVSVRPLALPGTSGMADFGLFGAEDAVACVAETGGDRDAGSQDGDDLRIGRTVHISRQIVRALF